jgi:hypothetical protein
MANTPEAPPMVIGAPRRPVRPAMRAPSFEPDSPACPPELDGSA